MIPRLLLGSAALLALSACDRAPDGAAKPAPVPSAVAPTPATVQPATAIRASKLSVIAVHHVKDFDAYRKHFESYADLRKQAGVTGYLMSRSLDDPQKVVVHFAATSQSKLDSFLASPELNQFLENSAAPESSSLWIAENIVVDLPQVPLAHSYSLYLRTQVTDFSKLQAQLGRALPSLRAQGLGLLALHRSTDTNEGVAILHLTAAERAELEAIYQGLAFQAALTDAGAPAERQPIFAEDVR